MRYYHSFWTKPLITNYDYNKLKTVVILQALSFAYISRLNECIVLHTDDFGKFIFDFIPYNEVHLTLNNLKINEQFWAAGKIYAHEAEPLGSVHIDGDVLIKSNELNLLLNNKDVDLIVQNIELEGYFPYTRSALDEINKFIQLEFDDITSVNCGLVKFNNQALKDIYIREYKNYIDLLDKYPLKLVPDFILEQLNLYNLIRKYNYSVQEIIDKNNLTQSANYIGYAHILGSAKYRMFDAISAKLMELNPIIYKLAMSKISQLESMNIK